ncbi:MAG: enoyl-CoA hydratase-related protein, partial [Promethearchaeia archaeon]
MSYEDIIYEKKDRIARITINRPQRYNACTQHTIHELIDAFNRCMDPEIGVVVFT